MPGTEPDDLQRPLRVGISARLMHDPPPELGFHHKRLQYLEQSIAHWIIRHGALAFMVPAVDATSAPTIGATSGTHIDSAGRSRATASVISSSLSRYQTLIAGSLP